MCTVAINVLSAFNPESQYFIPLFNKISLLCRQQPGGGDASHEGNSGPRGHDFMDNSSMFQKVPKIPKFSGSRKSQNLSKK
jgi:hypothetical protein